MNVEDTNPTDAQAKASKTGADPAAISRILAGFDPSRTFLSDREGMAIIEALGIETPVRGFVRDAAGAAQLDLGVFPGDRVVVKVASPAIQHRSDVGGVAVAPRTPEGVARAVADMASRLASQPIEGFDIHGFVPHQRMLGHELLIGLRWTADLGPIVVFGAGGIYAEHLAGHFRPGREVAIFSPHTGAGSADATPEALAATLRELAITPLLTGGLRRQSATVPIERLADLVRRFLDLARVHCPDEIAELEINPLVVASGQGDSAGARLVALDVLARRGARRPRVATRPVHKIANLLRPRTLAIVGVSEKQHNPGRVILQNVLAAGFDPARITIVKPGVESIDGCRCVPDVGSIEGTADLAVLSVGAAQVPEVTTAFIELQKAESLIVIPGGLEEKRGAEAIVGRMRAALGESRALPWQGPVINGGNCLGIRSHPGRYDTLFIPRYKVPPPGPHASPMALVCQSGAHLVANLDRLGNISPRYAISVGNQTDLTIGDYLAHLAEDRAIDLFAVYVEGFRPLDGLQFMQAASAIRARGGTVLLYRAGRTPAGARASQSHTASIAGDYAATRALSAQAGVVLAPSLNDFADLVQLFVLLREKKVAGRRVAALSNAGFECVAIADALGDLELATFTEQTTRRLEEIMGRRGIDAIVDVHNPLDLTPMMGDADYADVIGAVMTDDNVDVGVMGCVPLTPALQTLARSQEHPEDLADPGSIVSRMIALKASLDRPWVAVVEGGSRFDAMARRLQAHGVPTFRSVDRAARLLGVFCRERLAAEHANAGT